MTHIHMLMRQWEHHRRHTTHVFRNNKVNTRHMPPHRTHMFRIKKDTHAQDQGGKYSSKDKV